MNDVRHILAFCSCALLVAVPGAWGQSVELVVEEQANPEGTQTCILRVHVAGDEELMCVLAVAISTDDPGGFYQHQVGLDLAPPVDWLVLFPDLALDSYVDLGLEYAPSLGADSTVLLPDFDSTLFNTAGGVAGGWCNGSPPSQQGLPDPDGNVFVAKFTVGQDYTVSGGVTAFLMADWGTLIVDCPDFNGDEVVDAADLGHLLSLWGDHTGPEDLNGDGVVDIVDVTILLVSWGPCDFPPEDTFAVVPLTFTCFGCAGDEECDDGNVCTDDVCSPTGECVYTNIAAPCEDGDFCTDGDTCADGACVSGPPLNCDDGDACTNDACQSDVGCTYEQVDCNDGDICTVDSCDPGSGCLHVTIDCDDGDACTVDECDSVVGCTHELVDCDDGDACTQDSCDAAGGCVHNTVDCDDGNACTADSCDAVSGCLYETTVCPDHHACDPATGCCETTCPADLNGDGHVDAADLAILLGSWGPCP